MDDLHKHKCEYCGCVWEHSGGEELAHTCPRCHRVMPGLWFKYRGTEEVTKLAKVPFAGPEYEFYTDP